MRLLDDREFEKLLEELEPEAREKRDDLWLFIRRKTPQSFSFRSGGIVYVGDGYDAWRAFIAELTEMIKEWKREQVKPPEKSDDWKMRSTWLELLMQAREKGLDVTEEMIKSVLEKMGGMLG